MAVPSGNVVMDGFGTSQRIVTQGYFVLPPSIAISPLSPTTSTGGVAVITVNTPSNWSVSAGSVAVAGDYLSAVFTPPATPQTVALTVTDRSNPGNTNNFPIIVTSSASMGNPSLDGKSSATIPKWILNLKRLRK